MKPNVLKKINTPTEAQVGNLVSFDNAAATSISDSGIAGSKVLEMVQNDQNVVSHINNANIHLTAEEKEEFSARPDMADHTMNSDIHVSRQDRANWDAKETVKGAQNKANVVQTNLNEHANNNDIHITRTERLKWNNSYTKEDIDAMLAQIEFDMDWKESVNSYDDLMVKYPEPYDGWTANVLNTNATYRYSEIEERWILISANAIPLATQSVDGKMSKEDKAKLDGIDPNANYYVHPEDKYTRHVTDEQIRYWSNKADINFADHTQAGLMSIDDKMKLDGIEEGATNYVHPETHPASMIETDDERLFVTLDQVTKWTNKADNQLVTDNVDGLMRSTEHRKLSGVEDNANRYVHPEVHNASMIKETDSKSFISNSERIKWNGKYGRDDLIIGSGVFGGTAGTRVSHEFNDPQLLYTVLIIPTNVQHPETLGTIYVKKEATEFFVYSTGGNLSDTFDYVIIRQ